MLGVTFQKYLSHSPINLSLKVCKTHSNSNYKLTHNDVRK